MTILKKFLQQNKGLALLTFVMICLQIAGTLGVPKLVAKLIDTGIASGEASVIKKIVPRNATCSISRNDRCSCL